MDETSPELPLDVVCYVVALDGRSENLLLSKATCNMFFYQDPSAWLLTRLFLSKHGGCPLGALAKLLQTKCKNTKILTNLLSTVNDLPATSLAILVSLAIRTHNLSALELFLSRATMDQTTCIDQALSTTIDADWPASMSILLRKWPSSLKSKHIIEAIERGHAPTLFSILENCDRVTCAFIVSEATAMYHLDVARDVIVWSSSSSSSIIYEQPTIDEFQRCIGSVLYYAIIGKNTSQVSEILRYDWATYGIDPRIGAVEEAEGEGNTTSANMLRALWVAGI